MVASAIFFTDYLVIIIDIRCKAAFASAVGASQTGCWPLVFEEMIFVVHNLDVNLCTEASFRKRVPFVPLVPCVEQMEQVEQIQLRPLPM